MRKSIYIFLACITGIFVALPAVAGTNKSSWIDVTDPDPFANTITINTAPIIVADDGDRRRGDGGDGGDNDGDNQNQNFRAGQGGDDGGDDGDGDRDRGGDRGD